VGVFTLQFADMSLQQVQATLAGGGTLTTTYSASFAALVNCINDMIPPSITCPPDVTAMPGPGGTCATVTYVTPTATDNCPGVTVSCSPASGFCFPFGTTTVVCTATDASNNTATCMFSVTTFDICVQDDSDPSIVLLWNSQTGAYRFCCRGTTYTGVGKVLTKGSISTIDATAADRRLVGRRDQSVFRGTAALQVPPGTTVCTITDRDTRNNSCTCQ
jgi:hypothetical protein